MSKYRCGFIAIVGRPNVGKSTLLNQLIDKKISITSRRPQTTRHRILGIKTQEACQYIYVDTPGIHSGEKKALNKIMNKTAWQSLYDADLLLVVVEARGLTDSDKQILHKAQQVEKPIIIIINKVDKLSDKEALLPFISFLQSEYKTEHLVPTSALKGVNVVELEKEIYQLLPEQDYFFYPEEQTTDRSEQFIAAEVIREKLTRRLNKELPYALSIEISHFKRAKKLLEISATIWVERKSQKQIVVGTKGDILKEIGSKARLDLEKYFSSKIFLQLWVKVKEGWSDNEKILASWGYEEQQ